MTSKRFLMTLLTILALLTGTVFALDTGQASVQARTLGAQTAQATLGTAFTYQGELTEGGSPANGAYDFQFTLHDDASAGSQVGSTVTVGDQTVTEGRFTVNLDFGADAFTGEARWLEIGVRDGGSTGGYTPLTPRQELTAVPYALHASEVPWSGLTGVPSGLADGDDDTGNDWSLTGNAGTTPGADFLGTTDDQALELRVNSERALRLEPHTTSPNVIGGYGGNDVDGGVSGATISGGGASSEENQVTGDHGTIGGGSLNRAGVRGTVGGGQNNNAAANATIGGGLGNAASDQGATVGGGQDNAAEALYSTVGGGLQNRAAAYGATVAGGAPSDPGDPTNTRNRVVDHYGTVGGGGNNLAGSDDGTLDNAQWTTVGGGDQNEATGPYAVVAGGRTNLAGGSDVFHATVGGGVDNQATGSEATVGGGNGNVASGDGATVPGGWGNEASGNYSLAAGYRAKAEHSGSFVWADNVKADFASTADGQFLIRAGGGVGIGTNTPGDAELYVQGTNCCTDSVIDNHIAVVENESTNAAADVLALKTNFTNPNTGINFVTFFDASGLVGEIEGDGSGGIVLDSASSDFAERLPKQDPTEALDPGDVVGLADGEVSKETADAARAMVVSTSPIVLGNRQPEEVADDYVPIAFVGQVPVNVRGSVNAGDYIVPSGREDGSGVGVAPEAISVAQVDQIVGRALENSDSRDVTQVDTLVGLPREEILQTLLERRDAEIEQQEEELEALEARVAALEDAHGDEIAQAAGTGRFAMSWPLLGGLLLVGVALWQRGDRDGTR